MNNENGNGIGLGEISTIRNILMGEQMSQVNSTFENLNQKLAEMEKRFETKIASMEKAHESQLEKMKSAYETKIKSLEEELVSSTDKINAYIVSEKKEERERLSNLFAEMGNQIKNA